MALPRISLRTGLFALLLGVIVFSLFGSLVAANQALSEADEESAQLDAHGAALVVEREVRTQSLALTELFGPVLPSTRAAALRDTTPPPPLFDAVWVLDKTGNVVWRNGATEGVPDSAVRAAANGVAADPTIATFHGARGVARALVAVRLTHRGQTLGAAVGALGPAAILVALKDTIANRHWLRLRSGDAQIAAPGPEPPSGNSLVASSPVHLPGDRLFVDVMHGQGGRFFRTALWLLGVVGFLALIIALVRERGQTAQLAGRTAELERLYEEVARSNRMKSEFLANVSHELRTPLNAVVGFVEMLREGVYGEMTPRQAVPVDRIAASATHLRQLVDRLLDIAKIAAGRLEVHLEPLVLRPFVLNVASEMESLVNERGLALSVNVPTTMPRIRTDHIHLRQILINLLGNAVKYTPNGTIEIRARMVEKDRRSASDEDGEPAGAAIPDDTKDWVALHVIDSGVGIAPEDIERIFDEFEQVNAGARTDSARRGTGLGLAISRRLARLIGGDVTVVSVVGRGSDFTVWLPLELAEQKSETT